MLDVLFANWNGLFQDREREVITWELADVLPGPSCWGDAEEAMDRATEDVL